MPLDAVQPGGVAGASLLQFAAGVVGSVQAGIPLGFRGIGRGRGVRVCGAAASALRIPSHVVHPFRTMSSTLEERPAPAQTSARPSGGGVLSPPLVVDGIGCLPVTPNGAKLFFRLIDAWYGSIPTVLTSWRGVRAPGGDPPRRSDARRVPGPAVVPLPHCRHPSQQLPGAASLGAPEGHPSHGPEDQGCRADRERKEP